MGNTGSARSTPGSASESEAADGPGQANRIARGISAAVKLMNLFGLALVIPEEDQREILNAFNERGVEGVADVLRDRLETSQGAKICVAVIGETGSGKSTYINAAMGYESSEAKGAAETGETETTLYDVPGANTENFPQETYLVDIKCHIYDFFLILSSGRFTKTDMWLANEIRDKTQRKFFFLKTNIQSAIMNRRKACPSKYQDLPDEAILQPIREYAGKYLEDKGHLASVFLVDSLEPALFEFEKLQLAVAENIPTVKRDRFLLSVSASLMLSKNLLRAKVRSLRIYALKVALVSAAGGLVPLPGLSIAVDLALFIGACAFFQKQLMLDGRFLRTIAARHNINYDILSSQLNKFLVPSIITKEFVMGLLRTVPFFVASQVAEEFLKFLPLVGSIVGAPVSFSSTLWALLTMLNRMEKAATEILELCLKTIGAQGAEEENSASEPVHKRNQQTDNMPSTDQGQQPAASTHRHPLLYPELPVFSQAQ